MKQIYKYILNKTAIRSCIVLVAVLVNSIVVASAQTYNNGTWYSVYDGGTYTSNTGNALSSSNKTLNTYTSFVPNDGTFSFYSKLPGNDSNNSNISTSSADPKSYDFGVTNYYLNIGNVNNVSVTQNISISTTQNHYTTGKIIKVDWYYYTYTYTYNDRQVDGSGLNEESNSIVAIYKYSSDNKNRTVYISNFKVPMGQHIRLTGGTYGTTSVTKDFGNVEWGSTSDAQTVKFRSFLTNDNITVKLTSGNEEVWRLGTETNTTGAITESKDKYSYAIGSNKFAYNGSGACKASDASVKGKASGYDFNVYFCPKTVGDYEGTITISDGKSTATVTLKGKGIKQTPYIDECVTYSAASVKYGDALSSVTSAGVARGNQSQEVAGSWTASPTTINGCTNSYTFTFVPTKTDLYNTTNNGSAITCNLALDRFVLTPQTITWDVVDSKGHTGTNEENRIEIRGDFSLTATTSGNDATVTYISNNTDIAYTSGTQLVMVKPGKLSVTAKAAATCNYSAAEDVVRYFEILRETPTATNVSATTISYGQTLEKSTISGTVKDENNEPVNGEWSWSNPDYQPDVDDPTTGSRSYEAVFRPDNNTKYAEVTIMVTVKVDQAEPIVTWQIGKVLREQTTYGKPVTTTNTDEDAVLQITPQAGKNITYNANKDELVVGAFSQNTDVYIDVTIEATKHYKKKSIRFSPITIIPKSKVCLDKDNNGECLTITEDVFNNAKVYASSEVSWNNEFNDPNILNTDRQRKGIQFEPTFQSFYSENTRPNVILSFNGVPASINFTTDVQLSASNAGWKVYQSSNMSEWEDTTFYHNNKRDEVNFSWNLNPNTRYIKITYLGTLKAYVKALSKDGNQTFFHIHRRHGFEVGADRNKVDNVTMPKFGTKDHPLQVPQTITFRYYSLGSCGSEGDNITVSNTNSAFYADVERIDRKVGFDQWGEYRLTIRCTDVGQKDDIILTATDGTTLKIVVESETPVITSSTAVFYTGTEQNHQTETDFYRGMRELDFSKCFDASGKTIYDNLYIFGVTGNTEMVGNKFDYYNLEKNYYEPKVNVPNNETACNAHTPCFVYKRNAEQTAYIYDNRTFNAAAERLGDITNAAGRKLWFSGYVPFANTGTNPNETAFALFQGDGGQQVSLYLENLDMHAREHTSDGKTTGYADNDITLELGDHGLAGSGALFAFKTESKNNAFIGNIYVRGDNKLQAANGAQISNLKVLGDGLGVKTQPSSPLKIYSGTADTRCEIIINDSWTYATDNISGKLTLIPTLGTGSVDLGNVHGKLTVNGSQLVLKNNNNGKLAVGYHMLMHEKAGEVAMLYGIGDEWYDCAVQVNDGTLTGETTLGFPDRSRFDGGTYNSGSVLTYNKNESSGEHPRNSNGNFLSRQDKLSTELEAYKSYGQSRIVKAVNEDKYHPLLPDDSKKEQETDVQSWIAVLPDKNDAIHNDRENANMLYVEVTDNMKTRYDDVNSQWGKMEYNDKKNSNTFEVNGRAYMLMQIDKADKWRTFVAPFDITTVYVLSLDNSLPDGVTAQKKMTWEQFETQQTAAAHDFLNYLRPYVTGEIPNSLPLEALYSKYAQNHPEQQSGIYKLLHYSQKNKRKANYYLYRSETGVWTLDEQEDGSYKMTTDWIYAPDQEKETDAIMTKGDTYAMDFFYSLANNQYDKYDYWSGKFILFEGRNVTLNTPNSGQKIGLTPGSYTLSGNSLLQDKNVDNTSHNVYRFNDEGIYEQVKDEDLVKLRPTESVLLYSLPDGAGMQMPRYISRTGEVVYDDGTDDENGVGNGNTDTTDDENVKNGEGWAEHVTATEDLNVAGQQARKVVENGMVYILRSGQKYTLTGQKVK